MKYIYTMLFPLALMLSCASAPKNFTYLYEKEYTGLDTLIDIDGYYTAQRGCDSSFFSMFMFYPDGLFTIATTSKTLPQLVECFEHGGKSNICKYPLWGTYRIANDTIKAQVIRTEGNGCTVFYDYKILPNGQLANVSDYVEPEYSMLGYMENYPSFADNPCPRSAIFHPLSTKRTIDECPFIKKKWFYRKKNK